MAQLLDFENIKELDELRTYTKAQYHTILKLQDDKNALMAEVAHLQELLSKMVMPVKQPDKQYELNLDKDTPSEVVAAMCQIEMIREAAANTVLDFQISRQLETYSKIVQTHRVYMDTKNKKNSDLLPNLSEDELLALLK